MNTLVLKPNDETIDIALEFIKKDEVIAFSTDTVYGIGANAFSDDAVKKIYDVKGRNENKPLILLVGTNYDIEKLVYDISDSARKLMKKFWPGALTIIFKSRQNISQFASAGCNTVGIRIPNHNETIKLLNRYGGPLATTSANISTFKSPIDAMQTLEYLNSKVPLIIDGGKCFNGVESTIVDTSSGEVKILRQGAISQKEIFEAL